MSILRSGQVTVAGALAALIVTVNPLAAQAADGLPSAPPPSTAGLSACSSGQSCLWPEAGYQGAVKTVTISGKVVNVSGSYASLWNDRSTALSIYSGANGSGTRQCVSPNRQLSSLSFSPGSVQLLSTTSC